MTTPPTNPLQKAAAHLKSGQRAEARVILAQYVRQNPNSENAWLMLSLALDEPKQQIDCLNIVLRINPANAEARERLDRLTPPPVEAASPPTPPPPETEGLPTRAATEQAPPADRAASQPPPAPAAKPFYSGALKELLASDPPAGPDGQPADADFQPLPLPPGSSEAGQAPGAPTPAAPPGLPMTPEALGVGDSEFVPLLIPAGPETTALPPASAPRRRNPVTCVLAAVIVITLVGVVAIVAARAYLVLNQQPTPTAVAASTRLPTVDLTALAFPTIPPSYTPSATPTITLTPTITPPPTQTPIPTPQPPDEEVIAQMQAIEQQAVELRGLAAPQALGRNVIERRDVAAALEELYVANGGTREALETQARVLVALGLIRPGYDLLTPTLDTISDSPQGFYVPQAKEINMIGPDLAGAQQWVYAYEYGHALIDANFGVAGMRITPVCDGSRQRCGAIRALIVSDAMLLMAQWFEQNGSPEDAEAFNDYDLSEPVVPSLSSPRFIERQQAFPYVEGKVFVEALFAEGGWEQVNGAYTTLPQTTEHILHPEKYLAGEPPIQLETPELGNALSDAWQLIAADSLGEWMTFLTLSAGLEQAAQVEEQTGRQAASGWGGDVYQAYYNGEADQTMLIVHWAWDSPEDAGEFLDAMRAHQDARFGGARVDRADGDCWEAGGQASCVFAAGAETLWILAPDQPTINNILSRFPAFQ